jgi:hypothetical protein
MHFLHKLPLSITPGPMAMTLAQDITPAQPGPAPLACRVCIFEDLNPLLPPAAEKIKYPKVRFWDADDYNAKFGTRKGTAEFFETEDGTTFTKERRDALAAMIRRCWRTLVDHGWHPASWGEIDEVSWRWFQSSIYLEFPDLRLCSDDWKLQRWCSKHYSDWRSTHVSSAGHVREQHAGHANLKQSLSVEVIEVDEDNDQDKQSQPQKCST